MKAQIEQFSQPGGILRVWASPEAQYGDPYQLSLTVRWLSPDSIELLGLCRDDADPGLQKLTVTPAMWRAIRAEVVVLGIKRVKYLRFNTGRLRERWFYTERLAKRGLPKT